MPTTHTVSSSSAWATAGGTLSGTHDGSTATNWNMSRVVRGWVEWDLGSDKTISQIRLHLPAGESDETISLWISSDQYKWVRVVDPTLVGGSGGWYEYDFIPMTGRYVMFWHHAEQGGGGNVYINEFEAVQLDAPPGGSVDRTVWRQLREGTQTASGTAAGNPAWTWQFHRFDGNSGGEWESNSAASSSWIKIDLGSALEVRGFVFTTDRGDQVSFQPQSSDNDSTWTDRGTSTVGDYTASTQHEVTFSPVSARYWRIEGGNVSGTEALQVGFWGLLLPDETFTGAITQAIGQASETDTADSFTVYKPIFEPLGSQPSTTDSVPDVMTAYKPIFVTLRPDPLLPRTRDEAGAIDANVGIDIVHYPTPTVDVNGYPLRHGYVWRFKPSGTVERVVWMSGIPLGKGVGFQDGEGWERISNLITVDAAGEETFKQWIEDAARDFDGQSETVARASIQALIDNL